MYYTILHRIPKFFCSTVAVVWISNKRALGFFGATAQGMLLFFLCLPRLTKASSDKKKSWFPSFEKVRIFTLAPLAPFKVEAVSLCCLSAH